MARNVFIDLGIAAVRRKACCSTIGWNREGAPGLRSTVLTDHESDPGLCVAEAFAATMDLATFLVAGWDPCSTEAPGQMGHRGWRSANK